MRIPSVLRSRQAGYLALCVLAVIVGTAVYAGLSHHDADVNLAHSALEGLRVIEGGASRNFPDGKASPLSDALNENTEKVDLFLMSDSGHRMPRTRDNLEASLLMFQVANQVWILRDAGQDLPPTADIAQLSSAIARSPELQSLVSVDASGTERIDNREMRAVDLALGIAQAERIQAEESLAAE